MSSLKQVESYNKSLDSYMVLLKSPKRKILPDALFGCLDLLQDRFYLAFLCAATDSDYDVTAKL